MGGILMEREPPLGASQTPEVIEPIPGRNGDRVISVRKEDRVSVANGVRDAFTVLGVQHLLSESLRRIDAVVIHLLEDRLAVASVMLVRRKAAPVARRVEGFAHHESLCV